MLLEPETPLRRCAELDFGFLSVATPVGMHICYLQLKLSTGAAGLVAQSLSCKTLPTELGRLRFCRKWSLEHALPVSPWSCKSSKRGFSQQVRAIPGELNRTKPETPLSRSAELDFVFACCYSCRYAHLLPATQAQHWCSQCRSVISKLQNPPRDASETPSFAGNAA